MCDMREVASAVDVLAENGAPPLALLHCVSNYPAAVAEANLRAMATLRRAFGVPVGWSDHTLGPEAAAAAVALGAALLERHLTLDRALPGPDHAAALEPAAFGQMVRSIRAIEQALGDGRKQPSEPERAIAAVARKSLHWSVAVAPGAIVEAGQLRALRPGTGFLPSRIEELLGRRIARPVRAGAMVVPEDFEEAPS
jgi:N-acetylneuraminate synthase/N,N'-diacetyllegionaminate synthase